MKLKLLGVVIAAVVGATGAQADTLEQSVTNSLLTHPKIKQAYDLYQSRSHQIDQARAGYKPKLDVAAGVGPEWSKGTGAGATHNRMTRRDASVTLTQMLFDGFDTSSNGPC